MTISPKLKAQAARFVRLFAVAVAAQFVAVNGHETRDLLLATILASAEVAFRQAFPPSES